MLCLTETIKNIFTKLGEGWETKIIERVIFVSNLH